MKKEIIKMKREVKNTVANMKVAEMRKVAGQYGIKNASKYKREELEQMLIDAMVKAQAKAKKSGKKSNKAEKVEDEKVTIMASELVEQLKVDPVAVEELMAMNRKVLIATMKALHCKKWYRTYDKATMVRKILEVVA